MAAKNENADVWGNIVKISGVVIVTLTGFFYFTSFIYRLTLGNEFGLAQNLIEVSFEHRVAEGFFVFITNFHIFLMLVAGTLVIGFAITVSFIIYSNAGNFFAMRRLRAGLSVIEKLVDSQPDDKAIEEAKNSVSEFREGMVEIETEYLKKVKSSQLFWKNWQLIAGIIIPAIIVTGMYTGRVEGSKKATEIRANVRSDLCGSGCNFYHTKQTVIQGLPVMEDSELILIVDKDGIQFLKTSDIVKITRH